MIPFGDVFPPNFAIDVFKTLIGSFVGAGLAFWFALRKEHLTKLKERKAAGNLAVITLLQLTDDYLRAKTVIEEFRKGLLKEQPQSPLWMHIKPMHVIYSESLRFNLDSLVFLLDRKEGARLIEMLLSAERKYHDFFGLLTVHAVASEEIQRKLADAKVDPRAGVSVAGMESVAGFQLIEKTKSFVRGVFNHIDEKDSTFEEACEELPKALRQIFGRKGVIRIQQPTSETLLAQAKKALPEFQKDAANPLTPKK